MKKNKLIFLKELILVNNLSILIMTGRHIKDNHNDGVECGFNKIHI
jgi:hypothetical protein